MTYVYDLFRRWRTDGTIEQLQHDLREQVRKQEGREASPSAAILDSQTVKAGEKGDRQAASAMMPTRKSRAGGGIFS